MSEKACHGIRKVEKYVDEEGREVFEFVQVFGKSPESNLVKGAVMLALGGIGPGGMQIPVRHMRLEWAFPEGTSIKKAFEIFDVEAEKEVERFKKQQAEQAKANQVVRAGALPTLLGADGKAMTPLGRK
jgi:hypothetical protein